MPFSTEIFVMIIFIVGLPFFYAILKDSGLPAGGRFLLAYIFLVMSNCFTVIEEFCLNDCFNFCEHAFISLASFTMLSAILKMTSALRRKERRGVEHAGD